MFGEPPVNEKQQLSARELVDEEIKKLKRRGTYTKRASLKVWKAPGPRAQQSGYRHEIRELY
jgi:hypothetical protein